MGVRPLPVVYYVFLFFHGPVLIQSTTTKVSKRLDCAILNGFDFDEVRRQLESKLDIFGEFDEDLLGLDEFKYASRFTTAPATVF